MARPATARSARIRLTAAALLLASTVGCTSAGGGRAAAFLPPSRPAQFSMAGISWGIGPDSVAALIEPRGYTNLNTEYPGQVVAHPVESYLRAGERRMEHCIDSAPHPRTDEAKVG